MAVVQNTNPVSFAEAYAPQMQATGNNAGTGAAKEPKPKSQFWINVGRVVLVDAVDEQGNAIVKEEFISLPLGMALDDQQHRDLSRIQNPEFRNKEAARNALLDQLRAAAEQMQPGETKMVNLKIQLRRVNEDQVAPPAESNPFISTGENLLF